MKTYLLIITSIFILIFATSCSKGKPVVGEYYETFTYSSGIVKTTIEIEITESSKNKIVINGSELEKDGNKIEGKIENASFFSQFGSATFEIKSN